LNRRRQEPGALWPCINSSAGRSPHL
jgi:hypothetical protein